MKKTLQISTLLGTIHLEMNVQAGKTPIIFLHGIYFDRHLWDGQISAITDRTVIAIDMPHHGENTDQPVGWNLDDCASMLLQILDELAVPRVIAIGHSWGGMTILRAAATAPDRFAAIGLCNMPLEQGSRWKLPSYYLISALLPFRRFYAKQAAKVQFASESLEAHPEWFERIWQGMSHMTNSEIRRVDVAVRIIQDNGFQYLNRLNVPALALKGEADYVPAPPGIETIIVRGGHVSPIEAPEAVNKWIRRVIEFAKD